MVCRQREGVQVELYCFFNLGSRWEWVILYRRWAPGLVWTGAEIFSLNKIQSLDHPANSELLYRLFCPSPLVIKSFPLQIEWFLYK
jgi:hypothetical protein